MRAAAPALAAIEEDGRRAPKHLRPLFAAIAEQIFEPDLELERIHHAAGFVDAEVFSDLREEVGQPAWSYLRDARLETAARLLLETDISISEIGRLVGYGSPSTFRRPLRSFLGMPPSEYRRQARRLLERTGAPPEGAHSDEYWGRMLAGQLSDDEARTLDDYLGRLTPAPEAATGGEDRWMRLRRTVAEGFVYSLEALSFADQRRLIRDAVWFPDGTLFELLSRRSRETDPDSAVELALLAIDSLAANRMLELRPGLAALAWARLARARWRAGDLPGAERDLMQSERDQVKAEDLDAGAEAERSLVAAAFRWHQGRRRSALELADYSVEAHRLAGSGELSKALVLRAEVRAVVADLGAGEEFESTRRVANGLKAALTDVEEARSLLAGVPEAETGVVSLWLRIVAMIGDPAEMAVALPQARRLASGPLLLWFEGHCTADSEPPWREALERFTELDDQLWAARTTLDLARLCLAAGRAAEASTLASQLASILGARAASPEDLEALKPLRRATSPVVEVASDDLDRAESVLRRLEWDRRASRALKLAL